MKHIILTSLTGASLLFVQACENLTAEQRTVVGVVGGTAAGLITADILNADGNWRVIAALVGAAAGVVVAENDATQECAYARGDGTYFVAPCPLA